MRGHLTDEIEKKAKELLKTDIFTQTELRLLPYIQYVMMNHQQLDPNKINVAERHILAEWKKMGWIDGGASGMTITKEFWDAMNEILWMGYASV
jgi:hypothetical protein